MDMHRLRIGAPAHISARPLIFGITGTSDHDVDLVYHEPGALSGLLERGKLDAALIPSIEFLRGVGRHFIKGPSLVAGSVEGGMLLVSRVPIEKVTRIAVDEYSRTSIAALRIALDGLHHLLPDICVVKNGEKTWRDEYDAILLGGDRALHYRYRGPDIGDHTFDVGAMWKKLTGSPLVIALWAYNHEEHESPLAKTLISSRNFGMKNMSLLSDGLARTSPYEAPFLYEYMSRFWSYDMGEWEMEGLVKLQDYGVRYNLLREKRLGEEATAGKD